MGDIGPVAGCTDPLSELIGRGVLYRPVPMASMVQCPRCGDVVDRLKPLPVEALQTGGPDGAPNEDATEGRACSWCRHELLEG